MEQKAIKKLGIDNLEEILDYFEDGEREEFVSKYRLNKIVGSGGFGVVVSATDIIFNKNLALKIVFRADMKGQMLLYEYDILRTLDHPNVIKIYHLMKYTHLVILSMPLS